MELTSTSDTEYMGWFNRQEGGGERELLTFLIFIS